MLRAVGMTDADWGKPQVGVASSWNEVTPCNMPLDRLAKRAKDGRARRRRFPHRVRHDRGQRRHLDGSRGHARLAREPRDHRRLGRARDARRATRRAGHVRRLRQEPARHADGRGTSQPPVGLPLRRRRSSPATTRTRRSTSSACSRPSARCAAGTLTENELGEIERRACPTEGSCAGMFTANTMASVAEAHRHVRCPAARRRRPSTGAATTSRSSRARGRAPARAGIRPRQIMTKEAFENAIAVAMALGGSTNAVLHLLAHRPRGAASSSSSTTSTASAQGAAHRRHEAARQVPHDRPRPHRRRAGRDAELLDAGLLHGDCLTVTGQTMAENLADLDPPQPDGDGRAPAARAHPHRGRHRRCSRGSLAPNGAW